jgi:hypothetical protein
MTGSDQQTTFIVEPIEYEIFVGAHSLDEYALKARITVHSG